MAWQLPLLSAAIRLKRAMAAQWCAHVLRKPVRLAIQ